MWSRQWLVSVSMPIYAFSTLSSLCLLHAFLKQLLTVFDLFLQAPCSCTFWWIISRLLKQSASWLSLQVSFLHKTSTACLGKFHYKQCSGSVTFLYGSGFAYPYHRITDPDPALFFFTNNYGSGSGRPINLRTR
jgi:hypothetical protein